MKHARKHLGDSHNFGRRVVRRGERICKPRTVAWEQLLLAADSPLRTLLDTHAARDGLGDDAFGFLPTLRFYPGDDAIGGEVERAKLAPLVASTDDAREQLAVIVGRSLALWSWLGVADLHWENLVLGTDARGRIVFGPLDVEMILADLSLPTQTKLLPDADPEYAALCQHACGVRRVLPYLGKPVRAPDLLAMAGAYLETLAFLDRNAPAIAQVLAQLEGLRQTPIRVCLRSTAEYVHAASSGQAPWPPWLEAELEQMARGDVPYFFRLYGQKGIHYYANEALTEHRRLPLHGDVPQPDPMLSLARNLRAPSRQTLREEGLFTLIGAFDHPSLSGRHQSEQLELTLRARSLVVKLPSGEELSASRDLSAHVASVYLPCTCGEVRTVFVPPVTVCDAR